MINLYVEKPKVRLILSISLLLVVAQLAHSQDIRIANTSSNIGSGAYRWTVYVEAEKSVLNKIDHVEYRLPDAYGEKAPRKASNRVGKYPFSATDKSFQPFSIGVTIVFKDGKSQKLSDYMLSLDGSIVNPGGVAITSLIKLEQKHSVNISAPDIQGAMSIYVDDIHDPFKKDPFYIKISIGSWVKEGRLNSGANLSLQFSYGGNEYVLTGYTKTSIFNDYLFFKIYRKDSYKGK